MLSTFSYTRSLDWLNTATCPLPRYFEWILYRAQGGHRNATAGYSVPLCAPPYFKRLGGYVGLL